MLENCLQLNFMINSNMFQEVLSDKYVLLI